MQYFNAAILFTSCAFAAPVLHRRGDNTQAILNDFNTLTSQVQSLDNTVNSFSPNAIFIPFTTLDDIVNESNNIQSTADQITSATSSSSAFTASDAQAINNAFSSLESTFFTTLSDIATHEPAVNNAGAKSNVESGLQNLKTKFTALAKAVEKKEPASYKKQLQSITKLYIQHLNSAIAAYA